MQLRVMFSLIFIFTIKKPWIYAYCISLTNDLQRFYLRKLVQKIRAPPTVIHPVKTYSKNSLETKLRQFSRILSRDMANSIWYGIH